MAASENVTMKLRKFKIYLYRVLILHYKTGFFNTNISISWLVSHEVYICIKYLFDVWEMWTSFEFWPMKNISENYKPMRVWLWLAYRFTENYCCFLRVHSNSKEVSYLTWQNVYPNLKTACHIKQTFFLSTKLLENLLLPKYLICQCTFKDTSSGCFWSSLLSRSFLHFMLKWQD